MVNVVISTDNQSVIDLPQYAGQQLIASRRGIGFLRDDEYTNLTTGGIQLTNDVFKLNETVTLFTVASISSLTGNANGSTGFGGGLRQYPHILVVNTIGNATRDINGDYTSGPTTTVTLKCRAESSSGNGYLTDVDGTKIDFSWIVYMPFSSISFEIGAAVIVTNSELVLCRDTIKRFSRDQLNCRIWL